MIFLLSFGQNVLTGLLALFIDTVGFLTRAYAEAIDETAESSVEALHASGAGWLSTVAQAVFPALMPQLTSWMLYMAETNIRDATLVGILTGTGIGFLFDLYYKSMNLSIRCARCHRGGHRRHRHRIDLQRIEESHPVKSLHGRIRLRKSSPSSVALAATLLVLVGVTVAGFFLLDTKHLDVARASGKLFMTWAR